MIWTIISILILVLYGMLIGYYLFSWEQLNGIKLPGSKMTAKVSVIIIGRNESKRLPGCVRSIAKNDYPRDLYEIIYVDDHSEDGSPEIVSALGFPNVKVLRLQDHLQGRKINSYKKEAIAYALTKAHGDLILHTDADTIVKKQWIRYHVASFENNQAIFTAAPVFIIPKLNFISYFQFYDFLSTMGITGAGIQSGFHFMANGANMSYSKEWIHQSDHASNAELASGDDMFLIHQAATSHEDRVFFIKNSEAAVMTYPEKNWATFFNQRFRWAGKTRAYDDRKIQWVTILVFGMNAILVIQGISTLIFQAYLSLFLVLFLGKMAIDLLFLLRVGRYYKAELNYQYIVLSFLFYPVYYLIVGLRSVLPLPYQWKNRTVR